MIEETQEAIKLRAKLEDYRRFSVTSLALAIFLLFGMMLKGAELTVVQMLFLVTGTLIFSATSLFFLYKSKFVDEKETE